MRTPSYEKIAVDDRSNTPKAFRQFRKFICVRSDCQSTPFDTGTTSAVNAKRASLNAVNQVHGHTIATKYREFQADKKSVVGRVKP